MAPLLAVKLCRDLQCQQILLEGDANQVINIMKGNSIDWSEGGMLIKDALTICHSFRHWSIRHVKRCCNEATQTLAKDAILCVNDVIDLISIPHCHLRVLQ